MCLFLSFCCSGVMLSGVCGWESMSSDFYSRDDLVERGSIPLDIDNVHMLLQGQSPHSTSIKDYNVCDTLQWLCTVKLGLLWLQVFVLVSHHSRFIDLWFTSTSIRAELRWGSLFLRPVWGHVTVKIKTLCPDFSVLSRLLWQHNKYKALVMCLAQGSSVMTLSRTAADSVPSLFFYEVMISLICWK